MQNLHRKPLFFALAAGVLLLSNACGQQATETPNPTVVAIHAATVIASLPTAGHLTPRPKATSEPTGTPVVLIQVPTSANTATPEAAAAATTAPAAASTVDYTVKEGDTLLSIAIDHEVSMAAIMLANDIDDSLVVQLGQVLHIPTQKTWSDENVFWFVYIVQSGETLSAIASRYGAAVDDLAQVNKLADASALSIGQKLIIPTETLLAINAPDSGSAAASADAAASNLAAQVASVQEQEPAAKSAIQIEAVDAPADADGMRAQLLSLYNQARAAYGRTALAGSGVLQTSAQGHAADCAQRGYGSHTGSDGSTSSQRIARAGYTGNVTGENWAWARSAAEAFDMWFNQETDYGPHRSNILSARYAQVGFGVVASNGGYYFIADFGG
jgi:LysM repeat protein